MIGLMVKSHKSLKVVSLAGYFQKIKRTIVRKNIMSPHYVKGCRHLLLSRENVRV